MKKIYQIPTTEVFKVQTTTIMAGSEYLYFGDSVETASGAESRGSSWEPDSRSVWDDEE